MIESFNISGRHTNITTHTFKSVCCRMHNDVVTVCHVSVSLQDGTSALMAASIRGEIEVVKELVERGANPDLQDEVYM